MGVSYLCVLHYTQQTYTTKHNLPLTTPVLQLLALFQNFSFFKQPISAFFNFTGLQAREFKWGLIVNK